VRQELLVRKPGEYRLVLSERDTQGRPVVSTTLRTTSAYYTRRINADGSSELHIIRGARPTLGVALDNLLGQTVQAVAEATPLKIVGGGMRNGTPADKLELGPGRFVWVDRVTGLPLEEQVVSGGRVAHSVVIESFDGQAAATDREFDPESLGTADSTTVEDLGFRAVDDAADAQLAIGFAPLDVPTPAGFALDVRGYVDPAVPSGDAPSEGTFVSAFANGPDGVIVTQVARPGAGDAFVPASGDEDAVEHIDVNGRPAAVFHDSANPRLVFARSDVLVTVEGNLSVPAMRELAERIGE